VDNRRVRLRRIAAIGSLTALALAAAESVAGSAGDADLTVSTVLYLPTEQGKPKTVPAGGAARFEVYVRNQGPGQATGVVVTIVVPSGAQLIDADSRCTGTQTLVCSAIAVDLSSPTALKVGIASDTAGPLTLTASVKGEQADPNPGNNENSGTITVLAAGGGSGGGGTSALKAGKLTRTPVAPRAGKRLTATLGVSGSPLPSSGSVGCSATVRGKALRLVVRSYKGGLVRCAWLVPTSAKGARLSGTVSFTTGGSKLSRKFGASVVG
jgi:uncharacterized repeat protein (TIGR01451 family)